MYRPTNAVCLCAMVCRLVMGYDFCSDDEARSALDENIVADGCDDVVVHGSHDGWTLPDALLCAIVQNQYDGSLPVEKPTKKTIGPLRNCVSRS